MPVFAQCAPGISEIINLAAITKPRAVKIQPFVSTLIILYPPLLCHFYEIAERP